MDAITEQEFDDLRRAIVSGNRELVSGIIDEMLPPGDDLESVGLSSVTADRIVAARKTALAVLAGRRLEAFRMVRWAFQQAEPEMAFEAFGEIPIAQLKLRVRTINLLSRNGVELVGDMEGLEEVEMLEWENCGPAVVSEIRAALRDGYQKWQLANSSQHDPPGVL